MTTPLRILLADDDIEDRELIEDALLDLNPSADLISMENGREIINHLKDLKKEDLPCLIVLDYNMPELNGSEVLSIICQDDRYKGIPKLILSTSSAPIHIQECMSNGATAYFVKPDNMRDLRDLASKLISYC